MLHLSRHSFLTVLVLLLVSICWPNTGYGFVGFGPDKNSISYSEQFYGWMTENNQAVVLVALTGDAEKIISKKEVISYFQLKMRNFVRTYKLHEEYPSGGFDYLSIYIEIFKYNQKTEIYTGFMVLEINPGALITTRKYVLVIELGGNDMQIKGDIKSKLDWFVEKFANDYYLMEDLGADTE